MRKSSNSLHSVQIFPPHIPGAILWKARVVGCGASVPSGTHHGNGGEEGSVAGQVEAQAVGGLEIVAGNKVGVFGLGSEKEVDGGLWGA